MTNDSESPNTVLTVQLAPSGATLGILEDGRVTHETAIDLPADEPTAARYLLHGLHKLNAAHGGPQPEPVPQDESAAASVLRQIRQGVLDEARLLPNREKRVRETEKRLDKLAEDKGWFMFAAAQAHAMVAGKSPARRNAEIMLIAEASRWRRDVAELAPQRLQEFDRHMQRAIENPAPLVHDGVRHTEGRNGHQRELPGVGLRSVESLRIADDRCRQGKDDQRNTPAARPGGELAQQDRPGRRHVTRGPDGAQGSPGLP